MKHFSTSVTRITHSSSNNELRDAKQEEQFEIDPRGVPTDGFLAVTSSYLMSSIMEMRESSK